MTLLSYSQEEGLAGAASVHQKLANIIRKPKKPSSRLLLAPVFLGSRHVSGALRALRPIAASLLLS
jgi:hypothetical protein